MAEDQHPMRNELGTTLPGADGEQGQSETILGSEINSKAVLITSDDFLDADEDDEPALTQTQTQTRTQNELSTDETEKEILASQAEFQSFVNSAVSHPATMEPSQNVVFLLDAHDLKDDSVLGVTPADSISDLAEIVESERLIYSHLKAASGKPGGDPSVNVPPVPERPQAHPQTQAQAHAQAQTVNLHGRPTIEELQHLLISAQARALDIQRQIDLVRQQRQARNQAQEQILTIQAHTASEPMNVVSQNASGTAKVQSQSHTQSSVQSHLATSIHTTTGERIPEESQHTVLGSAPAMTMSNIHSHTDVSALTTTAGEITVEFQNVLETIQPSWSNTTTHTAIRSGQITEGSQQNVSGTVQVQASNIQSRPLTAPPSQFAQSEIGPVLSDQRLEIPRETGVARPSMVHSIYDGHEDELQRSTSVRSIRTICGTDGGRSTKESENVMSDRHEHLSNIKHQYTCVGKHQLNESDDALNRRVSGLIQPILAEQKNEVQREASIKQFGAEDLGDEAFLEESLSRVASNLAVQSIYCIDVQSLEAEDEETEVEELKKPVSLAQSQLQSQIESRRASIEQQLSQYQLSDRDPGGDGGTSQSQLTQPIVSEQGSEVQRELDGEFSYGDEESGTERDFDEDDLTRIASAMARQAICAKDKDCQE